jgi:hypothetical protein
MDAAAASSLAASPAPAPAPALAPVLQKSLKERIQENKSKKMASQPAVSGMKEVLSPVAPPPNIAAVPPAASESQMFPVKIRNTLSQGDCFYSAIYRSAKNNNLLEKLFVCIPVLRADTENTFIKKFREYISDNIPNETLDTLFYTLMELYQDNKDSFNIAVNKIGDIKDVVIEYAENEMLVPEYEGDFIDDIKKAIKKDKKYVGEIEVTFIKEILQSCRLYVKIFNSSDSAINEIQTDYVSNVLYKDTLYLINIDEVHYVYLIEDM